MVAGGRTPLGAKLSIKQCFEILSVQLDNTQALETSFCIDFDVFDIAEQWRLILNNGVLTRRRLQSEAYLKEAREHSADFEMILTKHQLLEIMQGNYVSVSREIEKEGGIGSVDKLDSSEGGFGQRSKPDIIIDL